MKRTAYLYALLMALCACTPQKRLARLISRYPALAADTTLIMPARIALPHKTAARLLDIPDTPCTTPATPSKADIKTGISVTAGVARASVLQTDSGIALVAEQLPDTITADIPVTVPKITTVAEPPPEKPINAFFRVLGIITAVAGGLLAVWKFIKIKP